jgi:hypothetical protein
MRSGNFALAEESQMLTVSKLTMIERHTDRNPATFIGVHEVVAVPQSDFNTAFRARMRAIHLRAADERFAQASDRYSHYVRATNAKDQEMWYDMMRVWMLMYDEQVRLANSYLD